MTVKRRILFSLIRSWYIASRKRYKCLFSCYSYTKIFFGFAKISRFSFLHEFLLVREYLQLVAAQEKSIVNINDYQNNILAHEFNIYPRIRSASLETKVYKAFVEQLVSLKGYLFKTIDGLSKVIDLWFLTLHYQTF